VEDFFAYDVQQLVNAFHYSELVGRHPHLINHTENSAYNSHNMVYFQFADVDLAFTPDLTWKKELAHIRELVWEGQKMIRIGNWVSTWQRELKECDYSSGVVTQGLSNKVFSLEELMVPSVDAHPLQDRIVEQGLEQNLLDQWLQHRQQALLYGKHITVLDVAQFLEGTSLVTEFQLAGRGLK